jgi:hypothetical protein
MAKNLLVHSLILEKYFGESMQSSYSRAKHTIKSNCSKTCPKIHFAKHFLRNVAVTVHSKAFSFLKVSLKITCNKILKKPCAIST